MVDGKAGLYGKDPGFDISNQAMSSNLHVYQGVYNGSVHTFYAKLDGKYMYYFKENTSNEIAVRQET